MGFAEQAPTVEALAAPSAGPNAKTKTRRRRRSRVKFGGFTVVVPTPSAAEIKRQVDFSTQALERVKRRLTRPGVRVYAKKDVPLYFADSERPGVYVRKLDGKTERGVLEDGAFKVVG
jgi:hypothetical protein